MHISTTTPSLALLLLSLLTTASPLPHAINTKAPSASLADWDDTPKHDAGPSSYGSSPATRGAPTMQARSDNFDTVFTPEQLRPAVEALKNGQGDSKSSPVKKRTSISNPIAIDEVEKVGKRAPVPDGPLDNFSIVTVNTDGTTTTQPLADASAITNAAGGTNGGGTRRVKRSVEGDSPALVGRDGGGSVDATPMINAALNNMQGQGAQSDGSGSGSSSGYGS